MDDVTSLDQAERILAYLKIVGMLEPDCSPCILVANKTDLVRNRVVKSSGGISIMLIPFNGRVFQYKMLHEFCFFIHSKETSNFFQRISFSIDFSLFSLK